MFVRALQISIVFLIVCGFSFSVFAQKNPEKAINVEETSPDKRFDRGNKWAILIGVNRYLDPKINNLKYCVADVRLMEKVLVEKCGYDKDYILVIADDQKKDHLRPLLINLQFQIQNWLSHAKRGDTVLIFFSGHGFLDQQRQGYLAPKDCRYDNLALGAFRTDELRNKLQVCKASQKILILDCCHSGAKGDYQGPSSEEVAAGFKQAEGLITLASSRKQQESQEWDQKQQGLFTYFLAEGLGGQADKDQNGIVDSDEIYGYLYSKVSITAQKELNKKQTPVRMIGEDVAGVFGLSRVAVPSPSPAPSSMEKPADLTPPFTKRRVAAKLAAWERYLKDHTREDSPQDWALAQGVISYLYIQFAKETSDNEAMKYLMASEVAIHNALEVYTKEGYPQDWAKTQCCLGMLYYALAKRTTGTKADQHFHNSETAYKNALKVATKDSSQTWVMIQNGLGNLYLELATHTTGKEVDQHFQSSETAFKNALQVYTKEDYPQNWAGVQQSLGLFYKELMKRTTGNIASQHFKASETALHNALQIFTKEEFSKYWAILQGDLGNLYYRYAFKTKDTEAIQYLNASEAAYKNTLNFFIKRDFPQKWAIIQLNLGNLWLLTGIRAERVKALEHYQNAEEAYQKALKVLTKDAHPQKWQEIQESLHDIQTLRKKVFAKPALLIAPFNKQEATAKQADWAKYLKMDVVRTNSIGITGMKLKLVPAGEFMMGSGKSAAELARLFDDKPEYYEDEHPQHRVQISKPFYLATTEVTQKQWRDVMGTEPWKEKKYAKEGADYAASYISWEDATEYCRKLSQTEGKTYRLPTEAEWEYACRAGSTTMYSFGDDTRRLGDYAWYTKNAWDIDEQYAHRVGQKKANAFGLYDMHGNVYEWCQDWYDEDYYGKSAGADPVGPASGSSRVLRGGSWSNGAQVIRSANRNRYIPDLRRYYNGFRVVCELY